MTQSATELPKVYVPADSPLHFLITASHFVPQLSLGEKVRSKATIQAMLLQVSEARELVNRGKTQEAHVLLAHMQQNMNAVAQNSTVKNNAQMQVALQSISETRFQMLGDEFKKASDEKRNELIKTIASQAKDTVHQVEPNLPLAANATNLTQKPLIGEVISKNDSAIVVKTAGGQQITVPLDNNLTVRTKEIGKKISLSSVEVGTTVALVGSSVGNSFTPTFILTNIPRELAAPEPVSVVKVNKQNHTMVISENGVPVQVNVNSGTIIKGSDTNISFDQIKAGDVVVVHGKPLTPLVQPKKKSISPTISPAISETPQRTTSVIPLQPSSSSTPQKQSPSTNTQTEQRPSSDNQAIPQSSTARPSSPTQTKPQTPALPPTQPKVIQSTSIRVIEKKEDAVKQPEHKEEKKSQPPAQHPQSTQSDQSKSDSKEKK